MQNGPFFARFRSAVAKDLRNGELDKLLVKSLFETAAVVLALHLAGLLTPIVGFWNAHLPQIVKAYVFYLLLLFPLRAVAYICLRLTKELWGLRKGTGQVSA